MKNTYLTNRRQGLKPLSGLEETFNVTLPYQRSTTLTAVKSRKNKINK